MDDSLQFVIPTIETERFLLREQNPDVMRHIWTTYTKEELLQHFGFEKEEQLIPEREKFQKGYSTHFISFKWWDIFRKGEEKKGIRGGIGYHTWYIKHRKAEVGYNLQLESDKRQGWMTELLPIVLAYGFEQMDLFRIEAKVSPTNVPSLKLLDKSGFNKEGHLREDYFIEGVPSDSLIYGLLLPEWKAGG